MNEDLYATLFEETDVSDVKDWDMEGPYFETTVMRLNNGTNAVERVSAEHGFFQLNLANTRTGEVYHLADFASFADAENAIADMQAGKLTLKRCLNDRGRYCYTMWGGLMDIAIKGALGKADFNPGKETTELQMTGFALSKAVQHETWGDLSARGLRAAAGFFNYLTEPSEAA